MTSKGINSDYTLHIYIWELGTCSVSQRLMGIEVGKVLFLQSWVISLQKQYSKHPFIFLLGFLQWYRSIFHFRVIANLFLSQIIFKKM